MRKLICLSLLALPATLTSQDLQIYNHFGVVSTGTHATTGNNYPWPPTTPPGYQTAGGVIAGTRIWAYAPPERFVGGHDDNTGRTMITVTGMMQRIRLGAALGGPLGTEYMFAQGMAASQASATPNMFEHSATGNDFFMIPSAPTVFPPGATSVRATVTLTTPIKVPTKDASGAPVQHLVFVEYKGGEQVDSTTTGETLSHDWRGGAGDVGANYAGFAEGASPRTITPMPELSWRPQAGFQIEEPILTATGFHGNNYYSGNPMANERYRGVNAAFSDWGSNNTGNSSLWFDYSCGVKFAGGTATVLANIAPTLFPLALPVGGMGNLLLNPSDPVFTAFADAGYSVILDGNGAEIAGSLNPIILPLMPGTIGLIFQFQGIVIDPTFTTVKLTNSSSIKVLK